ncbi:MAG TPA: nucleoside 2-deoxyribosyltransferase [Thermoanaerobaculia bacterium]
MTATIYFSGSISSGRQDADLYRRIVQVLREAGHRVLDGDVTARAAGHDARATAVAVPGGAAHSVEGGGQLDAFEIFDRDMSWLAEAEVVVAEVSRPSTGVGYEIAAARHLYRIPVIALYRPAWTSRCSAMISGDRGIQVIEYEEQTFDEMARRMLAALDSLPARP